LRLLGALAGLAAAAVALGVAELVAIVTGPQSSPVIAVGDVVIDLVPPSVKDFAVSVFGTHDKTALIIGTVILLAAFAAAIGALSVSDLRYGYGGIALFGLVGVAAAITRTGAGVAAALPSIVGALAGAAMLSLLVKGWSEPLPDLGGPAGRRRLLKGALIGLAAGAVVEFAGRQLGERRNVTAARKAVTLPASASGPPALPADVAVDGQARFVTSNDDFYRIDTALIVPQIDPDTWTLRIHGKVRKEITLNYQQLLALPMIERYITLSCVSNEVGGDLISNALFLGVPLKDLLEEAGPDADADQVIGRSSDGFTTGAPTAALMDGRDAMIAVGMNGEPLRLEHGFPARVVVPGLYGYVSATKWLTELELSRFADFDAYWVPRGWSQQAPIKTESRIDTPRDGAKKPAGRIVVAGVAWAQRRGISKVEVRVDQGEWRQATLAAVPSVDTWRQWSLTWDATPGSYQLQVRATDNSGQTQTADVAPPDPNGATGYHTIRVKVS
jgi:DMSO/TMAO reductase YedYZ molybdopterin-dependent catalytic subunit